MSSAKKIGSAGIVLEVLVVRTVAVKAMHGGGALCHGLWTLPGSISRFSLLLATGHRCSSRRLRKRIWMTLRVLWILFHYIFFLLRDAPVLFGVIALEHPHFWISLLFQDRTADLAVGKEIRVSPYRLAAHLATAFATFSLLVHTGFQVGGTFGARGDLRAPPRPAVRYKDPSMLTK